MKKTLLIEVEVYDDGTSKQVVTNNGFSIYEIIGLAEDLRVRSLGILQQTHKPKDETISKDKG